MAIRNFQSGLLFLLLANLAAIGQTTWKVSNNTDVEGDFSSLKEALESLDLAPGDILEIAASDTAYGDAELSIPLAVRGVADFENSRLYPSIGKLSIVSASTSAEIPIRLEGLAIANLRIKSANVTIENSRLGTIDAENADNLSITKNWIILTGAESVHVQSSREVLFSGNLFTISGTSVLIKSHPDSVSKFSHNTIIDETGTSEWLLYRGSLTDNILTIPEGRLARFAITAERNLSTRRTFLNPDNQDSLSQEALFKLGSDSLSKYLPKENGPAISGGLDDEDIGYTGGSSPIDFSLIPGSGLLVDTPPDPTIIAFNPTVGSVSVEWTCSEPVENFEIEVQVSDGGFGEPSYFGGEFQEAAFPGLEQGAIVQIRIRSIRDDLSSSWVISEPVTTTFSPPPVPVLSTSDVGIGSVTLDWSNSEIVQDFELESALEGESFGNSETFPANSTGTTIEGLQGGIPVSFRLRSSRGGLLSDWVEIGPVIPLQEPPSEPEFSVLEVTTEGVAIDWSSNGPLKGYELEYRLEDGSYEGTIQFASESTGTLLSDFEEGAVVQFRLRTFRSNSTSEWVESDLITIPSAFDPLVFYQTLLGQETDQYGDWFQNTWFGWFSHASEGIIIHLEHGYLYLAGTPESVYAYDYNLGLWFWTSTTFYPNLYLFEEPPQWYLFYKGTTNPTRYFYQYQTGIPLREDEI